MSCDVPWTTSPLRWSSTSPRPGCSYPRASTPIGLTHLPTSGSAQPTSQTSPRPSRDSVRNPVAWCSSWKAVTSSTPCACRSAQPSEPCSAPSTDPSLRPAVVPEPRSLQQRDVYTETASKLDYQLE